MMIKYTESKLVLQNCSGASVKVFGKIIIPSGEERDVFKMVPGLSETTVLDALQTPDGELSKKINQLGEIRIKEISLFTLDNAVVAQSNLVISGEPGKNKFITNNDDGSGLLWRHVNVEDRMLYDHPLRKIEDRVFIEKAGAQSNGYLSREDWLLFKGRGLGLRIWQYQDITGPLETSLVLSKFSNGGSSSFEASWIVDGTAVLVESGTNKPVKSSRWLGRTVKVSQHVGNSIVFSDVASLSRKYRIWFLVSLPVGSSVPEGYTAPPREVRNSRLDTLDVYDIDAPGDRRILGAKTFSGEAAFNSGVSASKNLTVGGRVSAGALSVSGGASGHVLMSNSVGDASWGPSPSVGSSPPSNPHDGQLWVKTPEYKPYCWISSLGKWLCTNERCIGAALNSTMATHTYLKGNDSVSNVIGGEVLIEDSFLIGMAATSQGKSSWKAEVHVNGNVLRGGEIHVEDGISYVSGLKAPVPAGSKVQLFVNGEHIAMPQVQAFFRSAY